MTRNCRWPETVEFTVVHQHPCKHYLGLMAFLIKFVNSLCANVNISKIPPKLSCFDLSLLPLLWWVKSIISLKPTARRHNLFQTARSRPNVWPPETAKRKNSLKCSPQRKSVKTTSNISHSQIPEQADSISSPNFTNLATLDAQLSLQTVTQPNGSQSLLTYTTCL